MRILLQTGMLAALSTTAAFTMASTTYLYIGTGTQQTSRGIYVAEFDTDSGRIGPLALAAETRNPGFLALHPAGPFLYSIGDTGRPDTAAGCLEAYQIDQSTGRLTLLNRQPTGTKNLVHVSVAPDGRTVLTASYSGATTTTLPINPDGTLGEHQSIEESAGSSVHPDRQTRAYPHSLTLDPAGRFAFVCDLGSDQLVRFRFDAGAGVLVRQPPAFPASARGAGPRHMAFHQNRPWAYVINELDNTIAAYRYTAAAGELELLQVVSTLPEGFAGKHTAAEVRVHPNGRFLYGSNRGHEPGRLDSMVVYAIDQGTGRLALVDRTRTGDHPRHFNFDPTGRWLLVSARESDRIETFAIDAASGRLTPHGEPIRLSQPLHLLFRQP